MFIRISTSIPSQHKQPLCGYTEQLCGSIPLKNHWKTTLRAPCLAGAPPSPLHNTNNHSVGIRNHCLGQFPCKNYPEPLCRSIHLKKLLENNFKGHMFIKDPPPSSQHKQRFTYIICVIKYAPRCHFQSQLRCCAYEHLWLTCSSILQKPCKHIQRLTFILRVIEYAPRCDFNLNPDGVHQPVLLTCSSVLQKPCTFLWI